MRFVLTALVAAIYGVGFAGSAWIAGLFVDASVRQAVWRGLPVIWICSTGLLLVLLRLAGAEAADRAGTADPAERPRALPWLAPAGSALVVWGLGLGGFASLMAGLLAWLGAWVLHRRGYAWSDLDWLGRLWCLMMQLVCAACGVLLGRLFV